MSMLPIKITAHDPENGSKIELKILVFLFLVKKMLTYGKQKHLVVCVGVCMCRVGVYVHMNTHYSLSH